MVAHTHEDVDALFGHVSMWLRRHDAVTLPGKYIIVTENLFRLEKLMDVPVSCSL